jgi:hypothetical protein
VQVGLAAAVEMATIEMANTSSRTDEPVKMRFFSHEQLLVHLIFLEASRSGILCE